MDPEGPEQQPVEVETTEEDEEEMSESMEAVPNSGWPMEGSGGYLYKDCTRNHAVSIRRHALDGCKQFAPAGEEGTVEALTCAACNCHRYYHRIIPDVSWFHHHQMPLPSYYYIHNPSGYVHPPPSHHQHPSTDVEEISNPSSSGGGSKKRVRTKFTQHQKDRMLAFAEASGWRIQKGNEDAVEEFCAEMGINRQVFKVWMHNNKHTLGKKP